MGKNQKIVFWLVLFLLLVLSACNKDTKSSAELTDFDPETDLYQEEDTTFDSLTIESPEPDDIIANQSKPKLCVIIDDFGNYNNFMLDSLLVKFGELPVEVAFAILPNLPYSNFVMEYFKFENRELLLHAPLQPQNDNIKAGELVINTSDDAIVIINKLNRFYQDLPFINGLNNHMGSKATEDIDVMTTILEWCRDNNLYFVDSATTNKSVAYKIARELGLPVAKRDIFLDVPDPTKATVDNYLTKMRKYYQANRNILVITHSSSLERRDNLLYFIEEAQKIGFRLVPVSEYLTRKKEELTINN